MPQKDNLYKLDKTYKAIKEWNDDEKPRERLIKHGPETLSNSELLAIIIRTGSTSFSALDAARELLESAGSLSELAASDYSRFQSVKGLGAAKAVTLAAAFELGKRIETEPFDSRRVIRTPEDVANYYIPKLRGAKEESFRALLLNTANKIFRDVVVSKGSLNASIVHPREVFKTAISESAASIILMHNHPSGNPQPSDDDIRITRQLVKAGEIIDIKIFDHIIIAGDSFTSFAKEGLL